MHFDVVYTPWAQLEAAEAYARTAKAMRANLRRFPYALFFVVDAETVSVLSCFHQHRDPRTMQELLGL